MYNSIQDTSNQIKSTILDLQENVKEIALESDNKNSRLLFVNVKGIINEYLERLDHHYQSGDDSMASSNFKANTMGLVERLVDIAEKIEHAFRNKESCVKR